MENASDTNDNESAVVNKSVIGSRQKAISRDDIVVTMRSVNV